MKRFLLAIALAVVSLHGNMPPVAAQSPESQLKVILLDNGYVLQGQLIDEGDQVLIRLGPGSQLRLPRGRITAAAASMDALYHIRHRQLHRDDAPGRVELARWCLGNDLTSRAGELLVELIAIAPRDPQVLALERQLRQTISAAKPATPPRENINATVQAVALQPIEPQRAVLDEITPEELVEFTQHVQPVLLNHCSAAGCHGIASANAYKILRPFHGQRLTQRMTGRNLESSLAYVNFAAPLESKLFQAATGAHPADDWPMPEGVRGERGRETLKRWLMSLQTGDGKVAVAASAKEGTPNLLQQGPRLGTVAAPEANVVSDGVEIAKPQAAIGSDPFDPDVFNRHFFPERFEKKGPFDAPKP